jgi:NAD+ kinase
MNSKVAMKSLFKTVAIVARLHTAEIAKPVMHLADLLQDQGVTVLLEADIVAEHQITGYQTITRDEIGLYADLAIVIGGDGTMLSVARLLAPYRVPMIGVNQGRLGFMTDISMPDMEPVILRMLAGEYMPESRMLLQATVQRGEETLLVALAFNDIVFNRGQSGAMIEFEILIDNQFVYSQRSDGLIVSTPTGSTAYALAAGGPILHPTLPAIALVPVCPQSLNNRPIAVNDTCLITFLLTRGQDARVYFDNQSDIDLREMDKVMISRYQYALTILHPLGYRYYDVLRHKLHWGEKL